MNVLALSQGGFWLFSLTRRRKIDLILNCLQLGTPSFGLGPKLAQLARMGLGRSKKPRPRLRRGKLLPLALKCSGNSGEVPTLLQLLLGGTALPEGGLSFCLDAKLARLGGPKNQGCYRWR